MLTQFRWAKTCKGRLSKLQCPSSTKIGSSGDNMARDLGSLLGSLGEAIFTHQDG